MNIQRELSATVGLLCPNEVVRVGMQAALSQFRDIGIVWSTDRATNAASLPDPAPCVLIVEADVGQHQLAEALSALTSSAQRANLLLFAKSLDAALLRQVLELGVKGVVLHSDSHDILVMAIRTLARGHSFLTPSLSDTVRDILVSESQAPLTERERIVLSLVAEGLSSKNIAKKLGISARTVDVHRLHLMRKLGAHTSVELVRLAIRKGLAPA